MSAYVLPRQTILAAFVTVTSLDKSRSAASIVTKIRNSPTQLWGLDQSQLATGKHLVDCLQVGAASSLC